MHGNIRITKKEMSYYTNDTSVDCTFAKYGYQTEIGELKFDDET